MYRIKCGDVWQVSLKETQGHEIKGDRPAVVIAVHVETELIIANRRISWEITTMEEEDANENNCDLSNTQKLAVASTFNAILETYTNESQLALFLMTMQSMLEDNIDLSAEDDDTCSMIYLLDGLLCLQKV